jgi:hypothetical protein
MYCTAGAAGPVNLFKNERVRPADRRSWLAPYISRIQLLCACVYVCRRRRMLYCLYVSHYMHLQMLSVVVKDMVQRIQRGVNTKLKQSILANWRPGHFSFCILKGHHHMRSRKPFSAAQRLIWWLCLVKVTLRRSFQQSAILSLTLTLTFRSLSFPESQFSKTWQRKAILRGKGGSGLLYSGIDEFQASHLTETEKCRKVNFKAIF